MMQRHSVCSQSIATVVCLLILTLPGIETLEAKSNGKGGGNKPPPSSESAPMVLDQERYFFRVQGEDSCLGEDDELEWSASGALAPGESFSFSPNVDACNGHPAAITVVASWGNGSLSLSSLVPDADYSSWDAEQFGRLVVAPKVDYRAQLCMFPTFRSEGVNYTITVTNDSAETVQDIVLHGRHENDWTIFYYPRCLNADADGDGWNDSLEHSMANMVYPNGYIDGVFQPDIMWGSNYLRGHAQTPTMDDEIDSYPPDFNDDGRVDQLDLLLVDARLGEGNGIPLEEISPNAGEFSYHNNSLPWRRYDLDGDGFVGEEDHQIVVQILEQSVPMSTDVISPTARITTPADGGSVSRGQSVMIKAHAWDNAALSRVDYLVNGKTICSQTDPLPGFGFTSPLFYCYWNVPKRSRTHQLEVRVYDAAGNSASSRQVFVSGK